MLKFLKYIDIVPLPFIICLFCKGENIPGYCQKMIKELITHKKIKNVNMAVHEKVKTLTGIDMHLFRPPFGEYNANVITAGEQTNYYSVQWDVDSLDWKELGKENEINQVLNHKHLGNGSIILFHNDAKYTPEVLDTIIKGIKAKGYEIVPLSELIIEDNYYMDHEGRQKTNTNKN